MLTGRVQKSGIESAQRSPINFQGFADGSYVERNFQSVQLTSSHNSSLAPPTPMSPQRSEAMLAKGSMSRSPSSSVEGSMNFVFSAGVPGCFTSSEGDQNLASPPETPQAQVVINPAANGWSCGSDVSEKPWHLEIPDEPLYTPAHDTFQIDLRMPQPSYLGYASQPVTPAFGQFNPSFMFEHHESPQYPTPSQGPPEYTFPDSQSNYPMELSDNSPPPASKQKTFHFSNSTPADFCDK